MRCSVETLRTIEKQLFSHKLYENWKLRICYLQFCKFSEILWFNLFKILDFERNNLFTHFCFSKLLILREKKGSRIFFGAIGVPKKLHIFKKYWKNTIKESCINKVQFFTRLRKSHFFDSPCIWSDKSVKGPVRH